MFEGGLNKEGGGLFEREGLFNLEKRITGSGALYCFSNNQKMVSILHKELECKAQEVGRHAAEDQKHIRTSST